MAVDLETGWQTTAHPISPTSLARLSQTAPPLWQGLWSTLAKLTDQPDMGQLNQCAKDAGITNTRGLPIQFADQAAACGQREYEEQISTLGLVPTRPNHWHDMLNACMWLTYPKTKAALNAVHVSQPKAQGRSLASDAATIFDESGAILLGPDPRLAGWLRDHDWKAAFVAHRALWRTHHLLIFGHSVLEKLAAPYPGMIAKVIYQPWPALESCDLQAPPDGLDAAIAKRWLANEFTKPSELFPLPVLGVPGADIQNEEPGYYDNQAVFRPKRKP